MSRCVCQREGGAERRRTGRRVCTEATTAAAGGVGGQVVPGPAQARCQPGAEPGVVRGRHSEGGVAWAERAEAVRRACEELSRCIARPDVREGGRLLNRDLSWLEFNARVLYQAMDEGVPLLERVRFLAIFTSNLDEFVMKRVGYLRRQAIVRSAQVDGEGAVPVVEMLAAVRRSFEQLEEVQAWCYERSVRPALAQAGITLAGWGELDEGERSRVSAWFDRTVFPVLTPLAVDPGHRFPFISNLSSNLGVLMSEPGRSEPLFARIKVPAGLGIPWWVRVPGEGGAADGPGRGRFVMLQEVIRHNLGAVFPSMDVHEVMAFRVTRAAEGGDADRLLVDAENLLDFVETQLKQRRFASVIRLEVERGASRELVGNVVDMFKIQPEDTDNSQGLLDFRSLFEIADLPRADLKPRPWTPVVPARLVDKAASVFDVIRKGDVLVHHPYESFAESAERFIAQAAVDPSVIAIKQTIYRTSRDSPFVEHLIRAAEAGKQVACLVELRARFDEGRNVRLAQALEKAGVHVAYGVIGLKTHCKAALVVRREPEGLRSYAHLGTGNYNPATAQVYTDLGLLTCDPEITADVVDLFNLLTGRSRKADYRRLLVAPANMKRSFLEKIAREEHLAREHAAGRAPVGGRVIAKMNALQDIDVTRALYAASQAGAEVDLFVRGFCCLRPGVPGLSERIRVTSVVGRFLEHSRLFHFGAGRQDPMDGEWYIGSADWMFRNLEQRVEAVCPVTDAAARWKLWRLVQVMSGDRRNAWRLGSDGRYTLLTPAGEPEAGGPEAVGTFETLMREAGA
ncbi:MAG: polyphosphate kinase 1 [Planctomyces sp.]|nr:polyphosphate kinase 1 [Planctomyces sp.]MBA4120297.1 polyphosphate kinase 1 [Isosphaera sp.]